MKIAIFSTNRSDFSILKPIIEKLKYHNANFQLIVSGSHTNEAIFLPKKNIQDLQVNFENKNLKSLFNNLLKYEKKLINYLIKNNFDKALILGDRYETVSIAKILKIFNIKIYHLCGGDVSLGSIDNNFRDSITNLSDIHFVSNKSSKLNLQKKGIKKNKIFLFGLPNLNFNLKNLIKFDKILKRFKLKASKKNILVTYHPVSKLNIAHSIKELKIILSAIRHFKSINFFFTSSNFDNGGHRLNLIIKNFVLQNRNSFFVNSFGQKYFFSFLAKMDCVVGNSSQGLSETSLFKVPTINIGIRQLNRLSSKNVIHCINPNKIKVIRLIKFAISTKFKLKIKNVKNPHYIKNSCEKIVKKILKVNN